MSNNSAHGDGGVIIAQNENMLMSSCLVLNNSAEGNAGVVAIMDGEITIATSTFKMNSTFCKGGVFLVIGGRTFCRNLSFVENIAGTDGGVLFANQQAVIHVTESLCFRNHAESIAGALMAKMGTRILIVETKISQNSASFCGAAMTDDNSFLELNRSHIDSNHAEIQVRAMCFKNSLFVAFNSSFNANREHL